MNKINVLTGFIFAFFSCVSSSLYAVEYQIDEDFFGFNEIKEFVSRNVRSVVNLANSIVNDEVPELDPFEQKEVQCLARAVYYESRGEPEAGRLAVAHVILNRVQHQRFPDSICGVVQQRTAKVCQFSWYCDKTSKINRTVYQEIEYFAKEFYLRYEEFEDVTLGALYFHADYVSTAWQNLKQTTKIGRHIFYRPRQKSKNK